jgi:hypothetical protein
MTRQASTALAVLLAALAVAGCGNGNDSGQSANGTNLP